MYESKQDRLRLYDKKHKQINKKYYVCQFNIKGITKSKKKKL